MNGRRHQGFYIAVFGLLIVFILLTPICSLAKTYEYIDKKDMNIFCNISEVFVECKEHGVCKILKYGDYAYEHKFNAIIGENIEIKIKPDNGYEVESIICSSKKVNKIDETTFLIKVDNQNEIVTFLFRKIDKSILNIGNYNNVMFFAIILFITIIVITFVVFENKKNNRPKK